MRLNYDCIRDFLVATEEIPFDSRVSMSHYLGHDRLPNYDEPTVRYTAKQLCNAGFIDFIESKTIGAPFDGFFFDLTWDGHQFLETIRQDNVWSKTKSIAKSVGSFAVPVLSEIASIVISKAIQASL